MLTHETIALLFICAAMVWCLWSVTRPQPLRRNGLPCTYKVRGASNASRSVRRTRLEKRPADVRLPGAE